MVIKRIVLHISVSLIVFFSGYFIPYCTLHYCYIQYYDASWSTAPTNY